MYDIDAGQVLQTVGLRESVLETVGKKKIIDGVVDIDEGHATWLPNEGRVQYTRSGSDVSVDFVPGLHVSVCSSNVCQTSSLA